MHDAQLAHIAERHRRPGKAVGAARRRAGLPRGRPAPAKPLQNALWPTVAYIRGAARMDLMLTAMHEGGHGVAAQLVGNPVRRLTLRGAWVTFDREVPKEARREAVVSWSGPLAEHHFRPTTVAQRRLLWEKEWIGDRRNLLRVDARVRRLARWRADRIVQGNWPDRRRGRSLDCQTRALRGRYRRSGRTSTDCFAARHLAEGTAGAPVVARLGLGLIRSSTARLPLGVHAWACPFY